MLKCKANAKVNIGLNVLGKRSDGYHEVDMIMLPIALADELTFVPLETKDILLETTEELGPIETNLVYKAAKKLQDLYNVNCGVEIRLKKNIPFAAGLGGGSADCAFTLQVLNHLWGLGLKRTTLHEIAASLGADVPFFLYNQAARVQGFGEQVSPIAMKTTYRIVLIKPNIAVSTGEAYAKISDEDSFEQKRIDMLELAIGQNDISQIKRHLCNSFERSFFTEHPEMEEIKKQLENQKINVVLSGSGPTLLCFDVTKSEVAMIKEQLADKDLKIIVTETLMNE